MTSVVHMRKAFLTLAVLSAAPCEATRAQHEGHGPTTPAPTTGRFGTVSFANSGAPAAQPAFLRGIALLHNFQYDDAASAFQEAQRRDPAFAMAYWGEAMTLNHGIWREQDSVKARAVLQRLGATEAERLAKAKTPREKDYLRALDRLYFSAGTKAGRDSAYAVEMAGLAKRYPGDTESQLFYSLALLSLFPRTDSTYLRAATIAEAVARDHPTHPGALHYIIHAYDDPAHANRGLAAARAYSKVAPDASHAQHMTSHIFVALGMWDDVVAANEASLRTVTRTLDSAFASGAACGHAGIWLHYAYLQEGRLADARRLSSACRARSTKSVNAASGYAEMRLQYIADVEQSDPDLGPLADLSKLPGFIDLTQSYASALETLRRGDTSSTNALVSHFHSAASVMGGGEMARMMPEMVSEANVTEAELRAMMDSRRGRINEAIEALTRATTVEDSMPFEFGPPEIEKPSHELLGEMLLTAGRPRDARRELEIALKRTPGRSVALLDLARACRAAGDSAAAANAYSQLAANWKHADSTLAALREVRAAASARLPQ